MDVILLILIITVILWALIEQKLIMTTRYTVKPKNLPKTLNGTSFIVLADLHDRTFGKDNSRLVKRIDELKPDYILIAGDMVNKKVPCYPSKAFTLLEELAQKYRIYYAFGNHEQRLESYCQYTAADTKPHNKLTPDQKKLYETWVIFQEKLKKQKVVFLDNEKAAIQSNGARLGITGVSINQKYFERNKLPTMENDYLTKLIGRNSEEEFHILIAHNPVYFQNYVSWGADLIISGHLHGGMVRIPGIGGIISPQAKFFPKYHSGVYEENGNYMVVSRGLGSHSIMPRLFNIPELIYVELQNR